MEAVRIELRRLARGYARAVGGTRAARWHLVVLVSAILLAFIHRAAFALPGFDLLAGQWLPALAAGIALYFLGHLLRAVAALPVRPREDAFARRLDDRFGWHDATETALTLAPPERERPISRFLVEQARGRLRQVEPRRLARVAKPRRWPRRILAFLFVAMLLLPGVDGLLGRRGGGTTGDGMVGSRGPDDPIGAPRPMKADFWLQTFVENPLRVEPLGAGGEEGRRGAEKAEDAETDKSKKKAGEPGGGKAK